MGMDRNKFLGGSDAAGVLGMSRWATPLSVWAEKTAQIVKEDISEKLYVKLGNKLENTVAELFMEETGKKVHRVNETIFHPQHDFIGANLDRRVVGEDALLECKTASAWKSKEWEGEEIPQEYILQCYHYLMVTGKQRCYLAVLIGNQDFKIKILERDDKLQDDMLRRELSFWHEFVIPVVMPSMMTKHDADTLEALFPQAADGKEIQLHDDANQLVEGLEGFKADRKNLDDLIEQHENQLKRMLGDAGMGTTGIYRVGWTNSKFSRLDGEALKAELPGIHERFYKTKPTRRFTYKKEKANVELANR